MTDDAPIPLDMHDVRDAIRAAMRHGVYGRRFGSCRAGLLGSGRLCIVAEREPQPTDATETLHDQPQADATEWGTR